MIYPTRAAVLLAAAGAPVALALAAASPERWYVALAWPVAVLLACAADALSGPRAARAQARVDLPETAAVGEEVDALVTLTVPGAAAAEVALGGDPLVAIDNDGRGWIALAQGRGTAALRLTTLRRGTARCSPLWVRWRGRLGLVWKQRTLPAGAALAILPDIRPVRDRGALLFRRHALAGLVAQQDRGDGTDYEALVEYRSGMDRRAIDWKQSARHQKLHAKEYRPERHHQIVYAIDAGRQMSDPVAGVPRVDRAISAALLSAWIALRLGDRVALWSFDSRPRVASGPVGGGGAFAELQRLAARIDYSGDETNHVLALVELGARLVRRSLVVLFTEITDPVAAQFLVRAAAGLARTHLLLVVVLRDEELETIADRRPTDADDVTRAVTAAGLLRDRLVVLGQLRQLGAQVVEAEHDRVGERLVEAYVDLKRRNLL